MSGGAPDEPEQQRGNQDGDAPGGVKRETVGAEERREGRGAIAQEGEAQWRRKRQIAGQQNQPDDRDSRRQHGDSHRGQRRQAERVYTRENTKKNGDDGWNKRHQAKEQSK